MTQVAITKAQLLHSLATVPLGQLTPGKWTNYNDIINVTDSVCGGCAVGTVLMCATKRPKKRDRRDRQRDWLALIDLAAKANIISYGISSVGPSISSQEAIEDNVELNAWLAALSCVFESTYDDSADMAKTRAACLLFVKERFPDEIIISLPEGLKPAEGYRVIE